MDSVKYRKAKALGLCTQCGKPNPTSHVRCKECHEKDNRRSLNAKKKRVEQGRCKECGRPMPDMKLGFTVMYCNVCTERFSWN